MIIEVLLCCFRYVPGYGLRLGKDGHGMPCPYKCNEIS